MGQGHGRVCPVTLPLHYSFPVGVGAGRRLRRHRADLRARYLEISRSVVASCWALGRPLAYQVTVDATFTLALDQLRKSKPAAEQLLELGALSHRTRSPCRCCSATPGCFLSCWRRRLADPLRHGEVAGVLYRQGLLTVDTAEKTSMHRLVQAVTLAHLPEADRHQRIVDAVELLAGMFPHSGEARTSGRGLRSSRPRPGRSRPRPRRAAHLRSSI